MYINIIIVGLHWLSKEHFTVIARISGNHIYSSYLSTAFWEGGFFSATLFILEVFNDFAEPFTAVYM